MCKFNVISGANAPNNGRDAVRHVSINAGRGKARHVSTKRPVTRGFIPLLWLFLLVFAVQTAKADENFPNGSGEGTEANPFQITTAEELAKLAELVNAGNTDYNAAHYKMMNDLDLNVEPYNTGQGWTPIGNRTSADLATNQTFRGVFDGNGYKITGLFINRAQTFQGLFGYNVGGTFKNLGIENASITANNNIGILVGNLQGGNVINCWTSGNISGTGTVGGIAGLAQTQNADNHRILVNFENSYSTANVTSSGAIAGGLIGNFNGVDGVFEPLTMTSCYATGNVTTATNRAGGLFGYVRNAVVTSCYATGSVTMTGSNTQSQAGGLGGYFTYKVVLVNCYATGAVSGDTNEVGGLVGRADAAENSITNCVALNSSVKGTGSNVNRIIGVPGSTALSGNVTWEDMLNKEEKTSWSAKGHNQKDGADKTAVEIKAAGFFETLFANDAAWTYAADKLPGFGETFDMPEYIKVKAFYLSEKDVYAFPPEIPDYTVTPQIVTVSNHTAVAVGPLSIELSGADAESFVLSDAQISSIAPNSTTSFTVAPIAGLPIGAYTATVTVADGEGLETSFDIVFNVENNESFSLSESGEYAFAPESSGYGAVTPLSVTVTNNLAAAIGPLSIELSGANAGSFVLSKPEITSIAADADDSFTVAPDANLSIGEYTATVTVTDAGNYDYQLTFDVRFTVVTEVGNSGTPDDSWYDAGQAVFNITNADQLAGLAKLVNEGTTFAGKTVNLLNDIDLSVYGEGAAWDSGQGWTPIGTTANRFQGTFDGNNNKITGLFINRAVGYQGLFGVVREGVIKKTGVENASVTANGGRIGILIGSVSGGTVTNCWTSGTLKNLITNTAQQNDANNSTGGLIGEAITEGAVNTDIVDCYSTADVTSGGNATGGLVAYYSGNSAAYPGAITNCHTTGKVEGNANIGSILGYSHRVTLTNCYATGAVKGTDGAGGIAGRAFNYTIIENTYSTGTVNGTNYTAGIAGRLAVGSKITNCYATGDITGATQYAGGIAGEVVSTGSEVANSYATGKVTAPARVGGIAGYLQQSSSIINCVALNSNVSGNTNVFRIVGEVNLESGANGGNTISDNVAFSGMTNSLGTTDWNEKGQDQRSGLDKSAEEIKATGFFEDLFADDPAWTYAVDKLPGFGTTLDMPEHIVDIVFPFELNVSGTHTFAELNLGYTTVTPLTVTVSNLTASAIGPVTIALGGANVAAFDLSSESITTIAGNGNATFSVEPVAGLALGLYTATVTVTDNTGNFVIFFVEVSVISAGNTGTPDESWYNASDPEFLIYTADQLAGFAQLVNNGNTFVDKTVKLANDIDLTIYASGTGWVRIGTSEAVSFQGTFDGDNKVITGLVINQSASTQGLFGAVVNGVIKNLGITNASVTSNGGSIGILAGLVRSCDIDNCYTTGTVVNGTTGSAVGGLIGNHNDNGRAKISVVSNCYSSASATGGNTQVGGLIGIFQGVSGTVPSIMTNCYATGNVISTNHYAGGLIGVAPNVNISNSYATGSVTGAGADGVGGLTGRFDGPRIENCFSTGNVTATGGTSAIGGLVGMNYNASAITVVNCYATGEISGTSSNAAGGIFGGFRSAAIPQLTISNCIALNPSVKGSSNVGRIMGNFPTSITFSNNSAFVDMLNNDDKTEWNNKGHNQKDGLDKRSAEIRSEGFFQDMFNNDQAWTYGAAQLPGFGTTFEIPAHISVEAAVPNITEHPASQQVSVGGTVTLRIAATTSDNGTLSYQWYSNSSANNEGGTSISGANNSEYQPSTATAGSFHFYVVVTNTISDGVINKTASETSLAATVEVTNLPTYLVTVESVGTGATEDRSYTEGTQVTITAGTPPDGKVFSHWTVTQGEGVTLANPNSSTTTFTMIGGAVTVVANFEDRRYTATLTVNRNNAAWSDHGKTFTLKLSADESVEVTMSGSGSTVTASVLTGTWKVYDGAIDTGVSFVIGVANQSATVNYFVVQYYLVETGAYNSGSVISATSEGVEVHAGDAVLNGKTVVFTVTVPNTTANYTYAWNGGAVGSDATYELSVNAPVNVTCIVSGTAVTGVETLSANPLKAWVNNGILNVSGLTQGKVWKLYSASGALVKQGVADSDVVTVSLELSGVYIIQSEGNTLKLLLIEN